MIQAIQAIVAILYARFSPRPMNCPKCNKRMKKMLGLNAYECPGCDHTEALGDGELGSIQTQLQSCREHCKRRGYVVSGEHHDEALSGASLERPGLDAAINALKRDDVLVVYMLDRLSRGNAEQWFDIEKRIRAKKARYESVCGEGTWGGDGSSEEANELIRGFVKLFDCYERKKNNRRTSESMIAHQKSGRRMTPECRVPFGKMVNPDDAKKLIDNPQEQEAIKTILAVYAEVLLVKHRGNGYREVTRRIKKLGIKARRGGAIAHGLVTDVIKKHAAV